MANYFKFVLFAIILHFPVDCDFEGLYISHHSCMDI